MSLVDIAFEKALVRLNEFVASDEYHRYLLKLIREVAKELGQKSLVIQVNAKTKHGLPKKSWIVYPKS